MQDISTSSPPKPQASSPSLASDHITSNVSKLDLYINSGLMGEPTATSTDEQFTPTNDPLLRLAPQPSSGSISSSGGTSAYTSDSDEAAAVPTENPLSTQFLQLGGIKTSSAHESSVSATSHSYIFLTVPILASLATVVAESVSAPRSMMRSSISASQPTILMSLTISLHKTSQSPGSSPLWALQLLPHSTILSGPSSTTTASSRSGSNGISTRSMTSTSKYSSLSARSRKFTMTTWTRSAGTSRRILSSSSTRKVSATISERSSLVAKTLTTTKIGIHMSKVATTKPMSDRAATRSSAPVTKLSTLPQLSKPPKLLSVNIPSTTEPVLASKSTPARKTSSSSSPALCWMI